MGEAYVYRQDHVWHFDTDVVIEKQVRPTDPAALSLFSNRHQAPLFRRWPMETKCYLPNLFDDCC